MKCAGRFRTAAGLLDACIVRTADSIELGHDAGEVSPQSRFVDEYRAFLPLARCKISLECAVRRNFLVAVEWAVSIS